jgi:ribosomal protein S27AE
MPTDRKQLEQELHDQMETALRKMLDILPEATEITLSDLEKAVGEMGQTIMEETLQRLVKTQQGALPETAQCPTCGEGMYRRGKRRRRVVTTRGDVEIERQYYSCPKCGTRHFPPG